MSSLFPTGCRSLTDLPYTIAESITTALQYLSFLEMEKDERPPKSIWFNPDMLKEHFEAVEKRREEKWGGSSGGGDKIEDPVQNDAARLLVSG